MSAPPGEARASEPILKKNGVGKITITRTGEIEYILDMALEEAQRMVKGRYGNFFIFDQKGELVPYNPNAQGNDDALRIARYSIKTRSHLNIKSDARPPERPVELEGLSGPALCVYMGLQEGDLGAIVLRDPIYFRHFFEADLGILKNFAATFSILLKNGWTQGGSSSILLSFKTSLLLLLENAHLHQKIRESDYQLNAVLEVSNLINSSRELNQMIQAVLYSARRVIRAESASLFMVDERTGELYFDIISAEEGTGDVSLHGLRIPPGQGIVGLAAQEKRSIIVNDARSDPRVYRAVDELARTTTRNILASPLLVDAKTIGVVEVINTIDRSSFTEHDLEIFQSFSDSVAIALQRRRLLDDLQKSNHQLEKRLREVTCLHAVAGALVEARSIDDLFHRVIRIIRSDLNVGSASILLASQDSTELEMVAHESDREFSHEDEAMEESLSAHVFRTGQPAFIEDLNLSDRFSRFARPHRYATRSCILIPLLSLSDSQPLGVLCVTEPSAGKFFEEDYRLLITVCSQMVRGFENFRLTEQIMAKKAMEKEVEITSRIQQNILPAHLPQHLHMDLAAKSVMAKTTGGDFYDFFVHSPNGDATLLVADVSGKSLPAALFMAISSSILRTIIRAQSDPRRILELSNDLLYEESQSGMFVTVFLARYEPSVSRLRYASAGHNDMLLIHADGTYMKLSGKGAPLGVVPSFKQKYVGGDVDVKEGDLIILYTDGVVEAVNEKNEEYSFERFVDLVCGMRDDPPQSIIDAVYESVTAFSGSEPQFDDFTMLVTRFHGIVEGYRAYHIAMPAIVDSIPALRDFVLNVCQRHGLAGQDLEDILLVSDEAATNIVVHAYHHTDAEGPTFECDVEMEAKNFVRLLFRDKGSAFDADHVREPDLRENLAGKRKGGFGVYLIKSLMNSVEYSRKDGVNFLRVEKSLR